MYRGGGGNALGIIPKKIPFFFSASPTLHRSPLFLAHTPEHIWNEVYIPCRKFSWVNWRGSGAGSNACVGAVYMVRTIQLDVVVVWKYNIVEYLFLHKSVGAVVVLNMNMKYMFITLKYKKCLSCSFIRAAPYRMAGWYLVLDSIDRLIISPI